MKVGITELRSMPTNHSEVKITNLSVKKFRRILKKKHAKIQVFQLVPANQELGTDRYRRKKKRVLERKFLTQVSNNY